MPLTAEQKKMYMAMQVKNQTITRTPGQIDGQQFIVDGAEDCTIEVFDRCAQVTIDDAKRCVITIGCCEDSLFIRDCEDCVIHTVCRQLRTRNCYRCKFYLWVLTEPIIESSNTCEFGEWHTAYPMLDAQFTAANLSAKEENLCHKVFDFTPDEPHQPHWAKALPLPPRVVEIEGFDSPPSNPAPPLIAAAPGLAAADATVGHLPKVADRPLPPTPVLRDGAVAAAARPLPVAPTAPAPEPAATEPGMKVGDTVDVLPAAIAEAALDEAGLKFNKARKNVCEQRGEVAEITMSGNVKVKFQDTSVLAFPIAALSLVGGGAAAAPAELVAAPAEPATGAATAEKVPDPAAAKAPGMKVGGVVDVLPAAMIEAALDEAGLKFNKARKNVCEQRGEVAEITMSGNVKVKFQTPVHGPDGELLRTDTSVLAFPIAALSLVDAAAAPTEAEKAGMDLSEMGRLESSSSASENFATPAVAVDETPPTPDTPNADPPPLPDRSANEVAAEMQAASNTPARGHVTEQAADASGIQMDFQMNEFTAASDDTAAAVAAAQEARLAELEDAESVPVGWEKDVSRTTGQTYYINSFTGESTYDKPTEPATGAAESEGSRLMQEAQALAGEDQWDRCVETVRRAQVRQPRHLIARFQTARSYSRLFVRVCGCGTGGWVRGGRRSSVPGGRGTGRARESRGGGDCAAAVRQDRAGPRCVHSATRILPQSRPIV